MKQRIVLVLVLLVACKKQDAESLAKPLESSDPNVRERTAKKLQEKYRADPKSLGDHGEAYWKETLERAVTDAAVAHEMRVGAEILPRNEGPGDPHSEDVRLDPYWIVELRENDDGKYVGYRNLERKVKAFRPLPPSGFNGTWKTYYVNGALDSEVVYLPTNRQERRDYYDDGKLREENVYTRDTLIPIGPLVHYYPSGKKAYEQPYTNGKMNGVSRSWYPSGVLEHEWPYVDGKREGTWTSYSESGVADFCVAYHADVELSRGCH